MDIQTILITAAPAVASIVSVICAVVSTIKKFKKVDSSLGDIKTSNAILVKENAELKEELKKVYKLHSELVEHIAYKE